LLDIKRFMGAFWACIILFAGLCGFAAIDLSTEYYMPGKFGAMLRLNSINKDGVALEFMGEYYHIDTSGMHTVIKQLEKWRTMLPAAPQISVLLTTQAYYKIAEYIEQQRNSYSSSDDVMFEGDAPR